MEDMKFEALVNKVAEACKACTSKELSCRDCPYEVDCVPGKAKDTLDILKEYQERLELQKPTQPQRIKDARDEALLKLYERYNNLVGLDEITYGMEEATRILLGDIEKLEHARQMEASDEIAKMAIEKLEKFARPMPDIKMDVKQFEEIRAALDKYEKKEGAKNDD